MLSKKIIKYIQSLSHKKLRDEENRFIAEGPKVVPELLLSENFDCKILCGDASWLEENRNIFKNILRENIYEVDEMSLEKISLLKTPNKVLAVFQKRLLNEAPEIDNKISLMLDDIQDPGNMGTIIRIADWFAIDNIICSEHCVDCYNPKVVQATMGSLGHVNVFYTPLHIFLEKNKNINVYAASLSGMALTEFKNIKGIILIGNESKGIKEELMNMATHKITIPRYGHAESLNAAVATGIILSHATIP